MEDNNTPSLGQVFEKATLLPTDLFKAWLEDVTGYASKVLKVMEKEKVTRE